MTGRQKNYRAGKIFFFILLVFFPSDLWTIFYTKVFLYKMTIWTSENVDFCKTHESWFLPALALHISQYTFCFFWRCGIPSAACTAGLLAICCANLRFCCVDCWLADKVARTSCADGGGGLIFCICVNLDGNGGRTSQFLSHYNQASSNYHT